MALASIEVVNGILYVSGNLDRAAERDLSQAIEKYVASTPGTDRVVDMSSVRWLAPTGAKVLIQAGQEAAEKGGKLRILASRHVLQTLNLLGAKTWLTIESCLTPTAKPDGNEGSVSPAAGATQATSQQTAQNTAATAQAGASVSGLQTAAQGGSPLAGPEEALTGGAVLCRVLYVNRRYNFCFAGGQQIIGTVKERVGGSWIVVESHGGRKMLNLDTCEICEML